MRIAQQVPGVRRIRRTLTKRSGLDPANRAEVISDLEAFDDDSFDDDSFDEEAWVVDGHDGDDFDSLSLELAN